MIDYTSNILPDFLREHYSSRPFDVILDTVGNDHALYSNSPTYLTPSGLFCTIGIVDFGKLTSSIDVFPPISISFLGSTVWSVSKRILQFLSAMALPVYLGGVPRQHTFEGVNMDRSRMLTLVQLIEEEAFKAVIDSTYKFTDVLSAYDRLLSRQVIGKVVIEVHNEEL